MAKQDTDLGSIHFLNRNKRIEHFLLAKMPKPHSCSAHFVVAGGTDSNPIYIVFVVKKILVSIS